MINAWKKIKNHKSLLFCKNKLNWLLKPGNWTKSMLFVVAGWLIIKSADLGFKYLELKLEANLKSANVSIEYQPVAAVKFDEISSYAVARGIPNFDRHLDDDLDEQYAIVPIRLKNDTQNPIDKLRFEIDLACPAAKILDVRWVARSSMGKIISVRNDLPNAAWQTPTNNVVLRLKSQEEPSVRSDIYVSIAKNRGFGRISVPQHESPYPYVVISHLTKSHFYTLMNLDPRFTDRLLSGRFPSGSIDIEGLLIPNPFRTFSYSYQAEVENKAIQSKDFLSGRTSVAFDSGFEPSTEIDLFLLIKSPYEEEIRPAVRMDGPLGVSIRYMNSSIPFKIPSPAPLDEVRLALMPFVTTYEAVQDKVVIYWNSPVASNYSGVKIYRSAMRAFGDFSGIGTKVFEGVGNTNLFEIHRTESIAAMTAPLKEALLLSMQSQQPPKEYKPGEVPPPSNFRATGVSWSEVFDGVNHFIDDGLQIDEPVTYTIYAFNKNGGASYPIVVNAMLDRAATNRIYRQIASTNDCIEAPRTYSLRFEWNKN